MLIMIGFGLIITLTMMFLFHTHLQVHTALLDDIKLGLSKIEARVKDLVDKIK